MFHARRSWHGLRTVRSRRIGGWSVRSAVASATWALVVACGGDDDTNDDGAAETGTTLTSSSNGASSSTDTSSGGLDDGSSSGNHTTTSEESTEGAGESTTGGPEDPSYPPPNDAGVCPNDTVPIELPGASVCGPFCAGADAACPAPSGGDAEPTCTPFADEGGSGTPCRTHDECPENEACAPDGTCVAVAFWACRLLCDAGQTCSDGMTCAGDACGYP
jgi:hypothetical protein